MNDFEALVKMAWSQYGHKVGLIDIQVEGRPGIGFRYKFSESGLAGRFMRLRRLHNSYEPMFANTPSGTKGTKGMMPWKSGSN